MIIIPYDIESQSRNADFISIARRAIRHPQRRRRCRPLSEANITRRRQAATTFGPKGRQPFSSQPFYTTCSASRALFLESAAKPPQQPSGPKAPSNLRTLRPSGRSILRTFTPQACPWACPKSYHIISPSTSWPSRGRVLVNCQSRAPGWLQVLPHWAHQRGVSFGREGRWIFSSSQE